ncbi:extensin family protein [uncultured Phycicoccus sp.]|uniref:extensin family protein n=1 Tax=uncultured Phycicoccus sp. TaxID=661422 RepID=UPI0026244123|nr:extensin family protein [uncultured Phycicoccus sp.]
MTDHTTPSRRLLLGGALATTALGGLGLATAGGAAAHGTLQTYSGINGARTHYEGTGSAASWAYRPSFHDRLNSWLQFWNDNTPSGWADASEVWGYGAHTDHRTSEAHNNGRGFDLSRIYTGSGPTRRFYARYDIWKDWAEDDSKRTTRRRYWATSAACHHHFRNVLTYLYNSAHWNHIHIDNLVSGSGNSTFSTSSEAQVMHVQASCKFVWGLGTTIDGVWGSQTASHSTRALRAAGVSSGSITTSQAKWLAFNRHTMRNGYDTQNYPAA